MFILLVHFPAFVLYFMSGGFVHLPQYFIFKYLQIFSSLIVILRHQHIKIAQTH